MNIGIVTSGLSPIMVGGIEKQSKELADWLSTDHNVKIFVRYNRLYDCENFPFETIQSKFPNIPYLRYLVSFVSTIIQIILSRKNIQVLFAFGINDIGFKSLIASKICNIPIIVSIRTESSYLSPTFIDDLVIVGADCIHVQSYSNMEKLVTLYPNKKIIAIPNGFYRSKIKTKPIYERENYIGYLGRLTEKEPNDKGIIYLINAMENIEDVSCFILGDGPSRERLIKINNNPNVIFKGKVSRQKVSLYLSKLKILIVPSVSNEGFPNVIVEAMSVGTPIIGTNINGINSIITNKKQGLIVKSRSSKQIKNSVKHLLKHPNDLSRMSKNARLSSEKYYWDNIGPKFEQLFLEITK